MITKTKGEIQMKKAILLSLVTLFGSASALAEGSAKATETLPVHGWYAIAAGIAIGLAAFGGALGQAKVGGSAMEGIARNPQARKDMFVPMIIGLALIESLVIYGLLIAFQLVGKIPGFME